MAILKRDDPPADSHDVHTILGPEAEFDGRLVFEGTVRIDGKFSGEIRSDGELIIGQAARLEAQIHVGSIVVIGKIKGDIAAKRSVEIQAPGEVHGNIQTPQLSIAKNVIFEGSCRMREAGAADPGAEVEAPRLAVIGDDKAKAKQRG